MVSGSLVDLPEPNGDLLRRLTHLVLQRTPPALAVVTESLRLEEDPYLRVPKGGESPDFFSSNFFCISFSAYSLRLRSATFAAVADITMEAIRF